MDVLLVDTAGQLHTARPGAGSTPTAPAPERDTRCGVDHEAVTMRRLPASDLAWNGDDPTVITAPLGLALCPTCEVLTRREHLVPRDRAVFDGVALA